MWHLIPRVDTASVISEVRGWKAKKALHDEVGVPSSPDKEADRD